METTQPKKSWYQSWKLWVGVPLAIVIVALIMGKDKKDGDLAHAYFFPLTITNVPQARRGVIAVLNGQQPYSTEKPPAASNVEEVDDSTVEATFRGFFDKGAEDYHMRFRLTNLAGALQLVASTDIESEEDARTVMGTDTSTTGWGREAQRYINANP
jgi:hypothetical protein